MMLNARITLVTALCTLGACTTRTTTQIVTTVEPAAQGTPMRPAAPASTRYRIVDKIVKTGTDTPLNDWAWVDADCETRQFQVLQIAKPPGHGRAWLANTQTHPAFATTNARAVCNSHTITAVALHYQPAAGFTGFDMVPVTVSTPFGSVMNVAFRIRVIA